MTDQPAFKNPFLSALDQNGRFGTAVPHAVQAWTQAQAKLFENSEMMIRGWLDRSRAAADATMSAVQRASECRDPAEAARIWADLAASQTQRATENLGALCEQSMAAWQQLAEAARTACTAESAAVAATEERPQVNVRRAAS